MRIDFRRFGASLLLMVPACTGTLTLPQGGSTSGGGSSDTGSVVAPSVSLDQDPAQLLTLSSAAAFVVSGHCQPVGATVQVSGAASASALCLPDGTFSETLDLSSVRNGESFSFTVAVPGAAANFTGTRVFCQGGDLSASPFAGGLGTVQAPYGICTAAQLAKIGSDPAYRFFHYALYADIDLSAYTGTQFPLIGNSVNRFMGSFEGNFHKISNFTYINAAKDYVGLFAATYQASIRNLELLNISIEGNGYVGGLIGDAFVSDVSNVHVTGSITLHGNYGGGIIANDFASNFLAVSANVGLSGVGASSINLGGFGGYLNESRVSYGMAFGNVTSTGLNSAGFAGNLSGTGLIENCLAAGTVNGGSSSHPAFSASFSSTAMEVRGVNFYNSSNAADAFTAAAGSRGQARSVAQLKDPTNFGSWDLTGSTSDGTSDVMMVVSGSYPQLWFEAGATFTAPFSGQGDLSSPYLITSEVDFNSIAANPRYHSAAFLLTRDLDFSSTTLASPGGNLGFAGSLDGNHKAIRNVSLTAASGVNASTAFIVSLGAQGQLARLSLENISLSGSGNRAAPVAVVNAGTIEEVGVTGSVASSDKAGGFVTNNYFATIRNSYSHASVSAVGLAAGFSLFTFSDTLTNNYSSGAVSAGTTANGFLQVASGSVTHTGNYWDTQASGQSASVGSGAGVLEGKSTAQMQDQSTFSAWDFSSVWKIPSANQYPAFQWQ